MLCFSPLTANPLTAGGGSSAVTSIWVVIATGTQAWDNVATGSASWSAISTGSQSWSPVTPSGDDIWTEVDPPAQTWVKV